MIGWYVLLGCQDGQDFAAARSHENAIQSGYCEEFPISHLPIANEICDSGRCFIESGTFWMGSSHSEDTCPMQEIHLDDFWIDETEVTLQEWERCQFNGACAPIPTHCLQTLQNRDDFTEDLPAICITWDEANNYCHFVGGRLPSEAEWEKSARGNEGATWAWGDIAPDCSKANYRVASIYCYGGTTSPVGFYVDSRSAYGLLDSNGNVFEWVSDFYDADYYQIGDTSNPIGAIDKCHSTVHGREEPCHYRVLRGGAYNTTEKVIRSSSRSFAEAETIDSNIGLRCAYDPE